jgi:hypothetical protein
MHKTRRRFRGYDYARGGSMFVTTCLERRRRLFGRVDHERVALSEAGEKMEFQALAEEDDVPMIRLVPTFMDLAYRPHGLEPQLFTQRRLLVLSRMADPAEPPRRGELLGLNYVAAAIARASEGGRAYVTAPQGGDDLLAAPSRGCKKGGLCNR